MSRGEQYLLAVYILGHREEPPVQTNAVADALDRSPATVTEAFQRFEDDGFVEYEPYKGVRLTDEGRDRAAELHETYVTLSWFFRGVLDLEDYEGEAMELASLVSPMFAERLASTLLSETGDVSQLDLESSLEAGDDGSS